MAHYCIVGQLFDQNSDRDVDGDVLSWLLHLVADAFYHNRNDLEVVEDFLGVPVQAAQEANQGFERDS